MTQKRFSVAFQAVWEITVEAESEEEALWIAVDRNRLDSKAADVAHDVLGVYPADE